jgi:general secretion pathway protein A
LLPARRRGRSRHRLEALGRAPAEAYVAHRIAIVGSAHRPAFDADAIGRIAVLGQGLPRRINLLCDRLLRIGPRTRVARSTVNASTRAAAQVFGRSEPLAVSPSRRRSAALGAGALAVAVATGLVAQWLTASRTAGAAASRPLPAQEVAAARAPRAGDGALAGGPRIIDPRK